jgi:hypothetical protein
MSAIHFLPRLFLLEIELLLAQAVAEVRWVQAIADDLRAGRLTWNGLRRRSKSLANSTLMKEQRR